MGGFVNAPELTSNLGWLNTDRHLSLKGELSGHVVVLDFWTYCCINCIHVLPDLAYLEAKYEREPVVFVGVHSAKFTNEASRETIRAAVHRYEIKHPVIIDEQMKLWRGFAVRSWPTFVIIDPAGRVVFQVAGEGNREKLDQAISQTLQQARAVGGLAKERIAIRWDANVPAASGLAFPGKVHADAKANRLFVADSNHNRIIIAEMPNESGITRVLQVVGSGRVGHADGPAEKATFNHPQGMVSAHGKVYVADTENHMIRAIDLASYEVSTVIGTGEMVNDRAGGGMGTHQGLNSPWDLTIEGSTLYVAMAGVHQIWRIELPVGFGRALAGSGRENLVDGPTETAALAQPSGICVLEGTLYIADSEVSAIRGIDMATEQVFTVLGEGLFSFGDVDGPFPAAKLQHPLGVAAHGRSLLVADTYNHKIKRVDPGARTSVTLYGTGRAGAAAPDGAAAFFEPGGLSVTGDLLFVADTNNHRVVRVDLKTGRWCEVAFEGLSAPGATVTLGEMVAVAKPIQVAANQPIELTLDVELPATAKLNADAPWSVRVASEFGTLVQKTGKSSTLPFTLSVPAVAGRIGSRWTVELAFAYCMNGANGVCVPAHVTWDAPVKEGPASAPSKLTAIVK